MYGVTLQRLAKATEASRNYWPTLRAERIRRIREHDPEFADQRRERKNGPYSPAR
ncbi:hypothetical protein ABT282_38465 [Streptomyces sp. NPDC000927]|uniref:hypothetical protein n=1 Tax=Streptomyces sp. NPDC000927 TaxID=3154371 RepID=UPI00331A5C89